METTRQTQEQTSGTAGPGEVVAGLWARIQDRDWAAVGELLAPDVVVDWPVSRERIHGRANFVAVQSEYPEGWSIRVLRIVADTGAGGDGAAASEVEVPQEGVGVFRVASFWTVRRGLITAGTEYWSGPDADPAPQWRTPFAERY